MNYPADSIDSYENLILLCPTHHAVIDKNGGFDWSIETLEAMKADHEARIDAVLTSPQKIDRDISELIAASITLWEQRIKLDDWHNLTWGLNYSIPFIPQDHAEALIETSRWLFAKRWPSGYPKLAIAFNQHWRAIARLIELINDSMDLGRTDHRFELRRDYKKIDWDPPLYENLMRKFKNECTATWWLAEELTRTVNLVITAVTEEVDPLYRFDDGLILAVEGDAILRTTYTRPEYDEFDWKSPPRIPSLAELRSRIDFLASQRKIYDPLDVDISEITFTSEDDPT